MIYLMCGLPGSGKSTWARGNFEKLHAVIVSRDTLRVMLYGGVYEYHLEDEPIIQEMAMACVQAAQLEGRDVIVDETCITARHRRIWMESIAPDDVTIVYCTEQKRNIELVNKRGYTSEYWASVIDKMRTGFEPPTTEEAKILEVKI